MEGLIPYLIHAIKRQKLHQHSNSLRCLSDGSRRSYHLLTSAGDSFNGGSSHHRRTQSEFTPPASMNLQPDVEEFVRSRSTKSTSTTSSNKNNNNNNYGLRQARHSVMAARNYDYNYDSDKRGNNHTGIKKFHPA